MKIIFRRFYITTPFTFWWALYRVFGLRLGPNLGVRPTVKKKFYFGSTIEKMHALVVFTEKYLRPYDCNDTNFTAAVKCTYLKTKNTK